MKTDPVSNLLYHARQWSRFGTKVIVVLPNNLLDVEKIKTEYKNRLNSRILLTNLEHLKNSIEFQIDFDAVRPNGYGIPMTTVKKVDDPESNVVVLFHADIELPNQQETEVVQIIYNGGNWFNIEEDEMNKLDDSLWGSGFSTEMFMRVLSLANLRLGFKEVANVIIVFPDNFNQDSLLQESNVKHLKIEEGTLFWSLSQYREDYPVTTHTVNYYGGAFKSSMSRCNHSHLPVMFIFSPALESPLGTQQSNNTNHRLL